MNVISRRRALASVGSLLGTAAFSVRGEAAELPVVELCPLGAGPKEAEINAVASAVRAFFAVRVDVKDAVPLPKSAFYPARSRYRAERLLEFLVAQASAEARERQQHVRVVVLGLAAVDISTTKGKYADWGVLGLATLDGRSAVLSSFRCKRGARDEAHARARFAKTAVHELGHSFGLEHCKVRGCLMHDGEGSVLTTDGESDFCDATRARLLAKGVLISGARSPFAS